jgi:hypothetical protein
VNAAPRIVTMSAYPHIRDFTSASCVHVCCVKAAHFRLPLPGLTLQTQCLPSVSMNDAAGALHICVMVAVTLATCLSVLASTAYCPQHLLGKQART